MKNVQTKIKPAKLKKLGQKWDITNVFSLLYKNYLLVFFLQKITGDR